MYSGTTFYTTSGRIIGAHQKIDRVARRAVEKLQPDSNFPTIKQILHFEGKNGPDGIKRKSPAQDEPWHYYDPADPKDVQLIGMIERHSKNLTAALRKDDQEKAAFEAAWLAHTIVDGLTPAHHFPLEDKLLELRGEGLETRTSVKDKLIIRGPGDSRLQMLAKNWEFWGAKGVMTTHLLFELGIATAIAPLRLKAGYPTKKEVAALKRNGLVEVFKKTASDIYAKDFYHRFIQTGWTGSLAGDVRDHLVPLIVQMVALAWYDALRNAQDKS